MLINNIIIPPTNIDISHLPPHIIGKKIEDFNNKSVVPVQIYYTSKSPSHAAENWEHALIGVSPFNSYFTVETLERLFSWALKTFKDMNVFIPTTISSYTFQAIGYPKDRAAKKTRKQDAYLTNKVIRALMVHGFSETEAYKRIVSIDSLNKNEEYLQLYHKCKHLLENDPIFRNGCLSTSEWVLSSKRISEALTPKALEVAVQYFLAELPLFLDTPRILNIPISTFVYKDIPKFLKFLYEKSMHVSKGQRFLTINY